MDGYCFKVSLVDFRGVIVRIPVSPSIACVSFEEDAANAMDLPVHFSGTASDISCLVLNTRLGQYSYVDFRISVRSRRV